MDDGGFLVAHFGRNVPTLAEVRILIYGAWNKTRNFGDFLDLCSEDEREASGKSGRGLHSWKTEFGDVVAESISQESSLNGLVAAYLLLKPKVPLI